MSPMSLVNKIKNAFWSKNVQQERVEAAEFLSDVGEKFIVNTSLPDIIGPIDCHLDHSQCARISEGYMDTLLENPKYGTPKMSDHRGRLFPIPYDPSQAQDKIPPRTLEGEWNAS